MGDNNAASWTRSAGYAFGTTGSEVSYSPNHPSGATSVTITFQNYDNVAVNFSEFSGLAVASGIDAVNMTADGGMTLTSGSVTTANGYDLIIAGMSYSSDSVLTTRQRPRN